MVDIARKGYARRKKIRRFLYALGTVAVVAVITWRVSRLEPAPPSLDKSSVWTDTVKRGPMLIEVRGPGTLVPEEILWIASATEGRVEKIHLLPGTEVNADTVILELSNPELKQQVLDAELQLRRAEAELVQLEVDLQRQLLDQQAQAATVESSYQQSRLQADLNRELHEQGLLSDLTLTLSNVTAEELEKRNELEQKRLAINSRASEASLAAKQAQVAQLRALFELRLSQVDSLKVRAGIRGVLQQTLVEVGQRVGPSINLGKVAVPGKLKAELRISETQAKDIQLGQKASIDTRNGVIEGRVVRIDPAAQEGTVRVDVELLGELPRGARPDLNVDGTIEIDRLDDTLKMGRPAYGRADSTVGLFKLTPDGREAIRVQVHLGRSSVTTVQILEGLAEGDRVILSDTSAWDAFDRIRLE